MKKTPAIPNAPERRKCQLSGQMFDDDEVILGHTIRPTIQDLIRADHPVWNENDFVSMKEVNAYRRKYTQALLEQEIGEITTLEADVLASMHDDDLLAKNVSAEFEKAQTFGEMLSDKIASFGGSWRFILSFLGILIVWIAINALFLGGRAFDPYPFILLNLVLSGIAALQAPVIMMSQNRQDARDRMRSEQDYKINLKAELEIRHMMSKLDQLRHHQWRRLLEIQNIQLDLMNELADRTRQKAP